MLAGMAQSPAESASDTALLLADQVNYLGFLLTDGAVGNDAAMRNGARTEATIQIFKSLMGGTLPDQMKAYYQGQKDLAQQLYDQGDTFEAKRIMAKLNTDIITAAVGVAAGGTTAGTKLLTKVDDIVTAAKVGKVADGVGGGRGALNITASYPSTSELAAAKFMAGLGKKVELRDPIGTRAGGGTSDLLVDGIPYDVYTPTTSNPDRIISAIAKKNDQTTGIVLDLSNSSVNPDQLGNILARVNGAGAANITNVVILGQ